MLRLTVEKLFIYDLGSLQCFWEELQACKHKTVGWPFKINFPLDEFLICFTLKVFRIDTESCSDVKL